MVEKPTNNGKINMYPQLDNGMQFRLNEINRIKDYSIAVIHEREKMSKILSKCIASNNWYCFYCFLYYYYW